MMFTKRLKKNIQKSKASSWKKKSRQASGSPTYTKQSYKPFKRKSSQQSSFLVKWVKKTAAVFAGFQSTRSTGSTKKRPGYRLAFLTFFLAIVGVGALIYSDRSWLAGICSKVEYFEVGDNVVIRGCHVMRPAEVRELAEVRYHTNLFTINPEKLAAILEKHPWVREAKIYRNWPNKLVIDITERIPEALVVQRKGEQEQLYYVDDKGVPFISAKPGQDLDFPVITGMEALKKSDKWKAVFHDAMQFVQLVKRNNPNLPAQSISEIHLDPTEGMVVYLVEYPFPIYFGVGSVTKKYKQLEDVLGVLYKRHKEGMLISQVEYIRMDYQENKVLVAQSGSS